MWHSGRKSQRKQSAMMREKLQNRGVAGENLFVASSSDSPEVSQDLVGRYDAAYGHAYGKAQRPAPENKFFLPRQHSL
jgi:hypothetical protein